MAGISKKIIYDMHKNIDNKFSKLPLKYYDTKTHGEILSRVTNDVDNITNTLQQGITHADHFIRTLPNGYNSILNEEASNISQGQKQLITITRAILANSKVLILDKATSSVDTRTEAYIQNAMTKLMEGRTNFVIVHRLSTIHDADLILVMNKGNIIEKGNHKELMGKNDFYADLYNSQFKGNKKVM